jgi:hypothetical protein
MMSVVEERDSYNNPCHITFGESIMKNSHHLRGMLTTSYASRPCLRDLEPRTFVHPGKMTLHRTYYCASHPVVGDLNVDVNICRLHISLVRS